MKCYERLDDFILQLNHMALGNLSLYRFPVEKNGYATSKNNTVYQNIFEYAQIYEIYKMYTKYHAAAALPSLGVLYICLISFFIFECIWMYFWHLFSVLFSACLRHKVLYGPKPYHPVIRHP